MSHQRSLSTRIIGALAATAIPVLGFTAPAWAAGGEVTDDTEILTTGEWFCDESVEVTGLEIDGEVTLTLRDGCILTATPEPPSVGTWFRTPAIDVEGGDTFTIRGTGSIDAMSQGAAAIGNDRESDGGGTIIIDGGTINVSTVYGAGIGSGRHSDGDGVTIINGGTVNATSEWGAGIGGGYESAYDSVSVNGGVINATSEWGAGVGSGREGTIGTVTMAGAVVTADSYFGAGIGSGYDGGVDDAIAIGGGTVGAVSVNGAGVGGGMGISGGTVVVDGGTVDAASEIGAGIGGGYAGHGGTIALHAGEVTASSERHGAGIGGGYGGSGGAVAIVGRASVTATGGAAGFHDYRQGAGTSGGAGAGIGGGAGALHPGEVIIASTGAVALTGGDGHDEAGFGATAAIGTGSDSADDGAPTHRLVSTSLAEEIASVLPVDMTLPEGTDLPDGITHGTFSVPVDGAITFAGTPTDPAQLVRLVLDGTTLDAAQHTIAAPTQDHHLTATAAFPIAEVNVTVDKPVPGKPHPDDATSGHASYSVVSVTWGPSDTPSRSTARSTATIILAPADGHAFSDATTGVVNGAPADTTMNTDGTLTLIREFPITGNASSPGPHQPRWPGDHGEDPGAEHRCANVGAGAPPAHGSPTCSP
ncbi:hypothetical protein [Microbacterium karelineae]|uniref:hypothetical protein n=1 Tax=Microbacterium karelineae TaxID=2654283 RepID=UPI0012E9A5B2|nr:hypothetical protein [Microbacterium karelineae]